MVGSVQEGKVPPSTTNLTSIINTYQQHWQTWRPDTSSHLYGCGRRLPVQDVQPKHRAIVADVQPQTVVQDAGAVAAQHLMVVPLPLLVSHQFHQTACSNVPPPTQKFAGFEKLGKVEGRAAGKYSKTRT